MYVFTFLTSEPDFMVFFGGGGFWRSYLVLFSTSMPRLVLKQQKNKQKK
jgi:hypothetical protein